MIPENSWTLGIPTLFQHLSKKRSIYDLTTLEIPSKHQESKEYASLLCLAPSQERERREKETRKERCKTKYNVINRQKEGSLTSPRTRAEGCERGCSVVSSEEHCCGQSPTACTFLPNHLPRKAAFSLSVSRISNACVSRYDKHASLEPFVS